METVLGEVFVDELHRVSVTMRFELFRNDAVCAKGFWSYAECCSLNLIVCLQTLLPLLSEEIGLKPLQTDFEGFLERANNSLRNFGLLFKKLHQRDSNAFGLYVRTDSIARRINFKYFETAGYCIFDSY